MGKKRYCFSAIQLPPCRPDHSRSYCNSHLTDDGQLGVGDTIKRTQPALVEALQGTHISHVRCGFAHSAAIKKTHGTEHASADPDDDTEEEGSRVYVWGNNKYVRNRILLLARA